MRTPAHAPSALPESAGFGWPGKLALAMVVPMVLLGAMELILRIEDFQHTPREKVLWTPTVSGFIGTYEFYIDTRLAPPGYLWVSATNTPLTDSYGFRTPEIPFEKTEGKVRVAFLGGSTTQGGFRPYPERAIRLLNQTLGEDRYEALNVACSSYSTHQSLIALKRWVLPRKPDIVFVYHGWNDVNVAVDGYSDKEKDRLVGADGGARLVMPAWLRGLRLTVALAALAEKADRTWPRQRVTPEDFEANLETMARLCAKQGARMIVMLRPEQRETGFVSHTLAETERQFMLRAYGTTNTYEVYRQQADEVLAAQRAVVARHPHVAACDGHQRISDLLDLRDAGAFGEHVPIFYSDNIHLSDFADELLAQQVAMTIAPEHGLALSNRIASVDYTLVLASELYREDAPREAAWLIGEALARQPAPDHEQELLALLEQCRVTFELVDLFRTARWGGDDPVYESKIEKLKRCLELRPHDLGIVIQTYRVCGYMDRLTDATEAMSGFKPADLASYLEWLRLALNAELHSQRWNEVRQLAEHILTNFPGDPLANEALRQIPEGF